MMSLPVSGPMVHPGGGPSLGGGVCSIPGVSGPSHGLS